MATFVGSMFFLSRSGSHARQHTVLDHIPVLSHFLSLIPKIWFESDQTLSLTKKKKKKKKNTIFSAVDLFLFLVDIRDHPELLKCTGVSERTVNIGAPILWARSWILFWYTLLLNVFEPRLNNLRISCVFACIWLYVELILNLFGLNLHTGGD